MMEEEREREMRRNNLILFNIPETHGEGKDEEAHDKEVMKEICEELKIKDDGLITKMSRLGKKPAAGQRPRPIKLTDVKEETRRKLLSSSKSLKQTSKAKLQRVAIVPDKTLKQREEDKTLYLEMKRRRDGGENVIIRNGKIVMVNESGRGGSSQAAATSDSQ